MFGLTGGDVPSALRIRINPPEVVGLDKKFWNFLGSGFTVLVRAEIASKWLCVVFRILGPGN